MHIIDLRSDTLTLPTAEILHSMQTAELGDDGRDKDSKGEDPTAVRVEQMIADRLGMEDSLFVPSGTLGNILCLLTLAKRGDRIGVADNTHLYKSEKGNFDPDYFGFVPEIIPQHRGIYDLDALGKKLASKRIAVLVIENSHNHEGGTVIPKDKMDEMITLCKAYGVKVHIDGARIFNAAAALHMDAAALVQDGDSLMVCVSKGLCAPVGSFVLGSAGFIRQARIVRKKLGGQLRQVGVLATAAATAVQTMSGRIVEDNQRAWQLAAGIADLPLISVDMDTVQTNIVKVGIDSQMSSQEFLDRILQEKAIRGSLIDNHAIRFVTYHGITDDDIQETVARLSDFCRR